MFGRFAALFFHFRQCTPPSYSRGRRADRRCQRNGNRRERFRSSPSWNHDCRQTPKPYSASIGHVRINDEITIRDVASDRFGANEEFAAALHHHERVTQAGAAMSTTAIRPDLRSFFLHRAGLCLIDSCSTLRSTSARLGNPPLPRSLEMI
jgi:hypothetical protein